MAGENESTFEWLCTCLCENYLRVANLVMLILGVIVFFFSIYMIWSDPLNDKSMESMKELANLSAAKWGGFFAGLLIITASCLGFNFAKTNSRCSGFTYLGLMLVAILLQVILMSVVTGGILSSFDKINEASGSKTMKINEEKGKAYDELVKDGKDKVISKSFQSWAKRWNNDASGDENYECTFSDMPDFPGMPVVDPPAKDEPTPEDESTPAAEDELVSVRRMDETPTPTWSASANVICAAQKYGVECAKNSAFGKAVNAYCQPKEGHEDAFVNGCSSCRDNWWDLWKMSEHAGTEVEAVALFARWSGFAGASYCRCIGRFMDSIRRHLPQIKSAGMVFGALELAIVAATVWVLMCGTPRSSSDGEDIEMRA